MLNDCPATVTRCGMPSLSTKATRGFALAYAAVEPDQERDHERIGDQDAEQRRRTPQDEQVLPEDMPDRPHHLERAGRFGGQVGGHRPVEDDPAVEQRGHPVGDVLQILQVLGDEHDRATGVTDTARGLPQPPPLAWVERRGRLVEEQHVRVGEEGDRQIETLPVPDGQRRRRAVVVRELEPLEHQLRIAGLLEPREELEILPRREPPVVGGPLRHPARAHTLGPLDRALARLHRAGEDREQRRLAGAVRPHQGQGLAPVHLEIGRRQRDVLAESA